ncbi:MAG: hypothetical protein N2248_05780 [candidate division WOR-3 bacterium]|nr:hypothetical protein [candidate division WOR-3 bacterium]
MRIAVFLLTCFSLSGAVNILPNPSFEIWLDTLGVNMPLGWLTSELTRSGSAVKDTNCNTGVFALRLNGGDTVAFATSVTVVRSGLSYEFSGYADVPGIVSGGFVLQFLTLRGGLIGSPQLVPVYYSNGYRRYSRWVTAPDSAFFLSVSCIALPGGSVYFDDVTVEDTSLAGIHQQENAGFSRRQVRKLAVAGTSRFEPGYRVYDVLGRRVLGPVRNGVYFLIPRPTADGN